MTNDHYAILTELSDFFGLMEQSHPYLQANKDVLADLWNDGFLDFYTTAFAEDGCVFVAASFSGMTLYDKMRNNFRSN